MQTRLILSLMLACLMAFSTQAQIDIEGKIRDKSRDRADQRADEGIDKGLDKLEEGIGTMFKKKKSNRSDEEQDNEDDQKESNEENEDEDDNDSEGLIKEKKVVQKQKLQAFTQYDFVPGDKILYFEDFSQDAIGDFPDHWTTNGGGEVKILNIGNGKWFHMNGDDAVYNYSRSINFPNNFIMEFDIIPDEEFNEFTLTFYEEQEPRELNDDLYPGDKGLHVTLGSEFWRTKGYNNIDEADWLEGSSQKNYVVKEEINHVIIWIQNRRIRIYHQGSKVLDMPTNIFTGTKFSRIRFSGWDTSSKPYISNIKVTTAAPDTRSKLLTEGQLISYGIYFDSGKDVVKHESYGAIKDIADVLKENPSVRVKIVGHTDSDGDNTSNLDLSKRRAASVKNYLVSQFQVNGSNIEIDGKGETEPIENNSTAQGMARNRRVEFLKL
ncbi:MAG: OmpA family protein [Marinilabiliaceae bacterium]|nr:OmpA family protein [Marinilabiliaceae bacterium]